MTRFLLLPAAFSALAAGLPACDVAATPEPPRDPQRIVSLLPAFTEILVALGFQNRLVGCTEYCEPGREVARVPWQDAGAAEAILRLEPDLVLRQAPRTAEDPLQAALEEAGVYVLALPSETVADVRRALRAIPAAVGRPSAGLAAAFDERLAAARARVPEGDAPRVLFVFQRDAGAVANVMAAGPGSFLDELITLAGGENALAAYDRPYVSLSLERLVRLAPDVIIDSVPLADAHLEEWREIPAFAKARIRGVRDRGLLIPGPRIPRAVERMAELIHGRS